MDTAPEQVSADAPQMSTTEALEYAGHLLAFIEAAGLFPEWKQFEAAADENARRRIVADIRMRVSPRF